MLGLTFANPADYDLVQEKDTFDIALDEFKPGNQMTVTLNHADGTNDAIKVNHTYNQQQIEWFEAGSALNLIKTQAG
jgi:aconitate hydratase